MKGLILMLNLTKQVLQTTHLCMEGRVTQEIVANSFIESYGVEKDYVLTKDSANDLFHGRRLYKADIVEYYSNENNKEYLVADIEQFILAKVFLKKEYVNRLFEIVKTTEKVPLEYQTSIVEAIDQNKYAEAIAEIFILSIRHDFSMKKMRHSA